MYYKGNNIGLNYDAATGTWVFNNEPQDFVDTNAFTTADPEFEMAPVVDDEEEEEVQCPEGYIYDNTLKQCVPDPSVQNRYTETTNDGNNNDQPSVQIAGTDRFTTDNNFIASKEEYAAMSASDLIENLKQRGFVTKNKKTGQLEVDLTRGSIAAGFIDSQAARFGQEENTQLNKKKNIIGLLVNKSIMDTTTAYPRGGMSATGDGSDIPNKVVIPTITLGQAKLQKVVPSLVVGGYGGSVFGINLPSDRPDQFGDITTDFNESVSNYASNFANAYITNPNFNPKGTIGTSPEADKFDDIEQSKRREAEAKARQAEADALAKEQAQIEARRKADEMRRDSEQKQQQSNERDKVQDEYKEKGQVTYKTKDTGGYVTTPNKPSAPPGERGGGGYSPPSKTKSKPPSGPDLGNR